MASRSFRLVVLSAGLALTNLSCGSDEARQGQALVSSSPAPNRPKELGRPISEDEAAQVAESLVEIVDEGDLAAFTRVFDFESLMEIGTAGIEAKPQIHAAFAKGARTRWTGTGGFADTIIGSCKKGGSYDLLRVRKRDHYRSIILRLTMPEGEGIAYHEYLLARDNNGQIKIVDCYNFFAGENLSTTIRQGFLEVAASSNRNLLERLTGSEREFITYAPKFQEATNAIRNGKPKQALTVISALPQSLRTSKLLLLLRVQAAQSVDEREYEAAIGDFRKAFPDDPCVDMLSIDYHTLRKEYPEALQCIDRLDRSVAGDPHLELLRAGVHSASGNYDAAMQCIDRLIDKEPSSIDSYWFKVSLSMSAKNYDETLNILKTIQTKFMLEFDDLTMIDEYKGFVASPQYTVWLRWLEEQKRALTPKR